MMYHTISTNNLFLNTQHKCIIIYLFILLIEDIFVLSLLIRLQLNCYNALFKFQCVSVFFFGLFMYHGNKKISVFIFYKIIF